MLAQIEQTITCPYCWEGIEILVDSTADSEYVEDCQVCCQPILINMSVYENGKIFVEAKREND